MTVDQPDFPAETFNAAAAQVEATLAAYEIAKVQQEEAAHALNALSCRAAFTYGVPGPYDGDFAVIEGECGLPAEHDGDHVDHYDETAANTTSLAYRQAVKRFRAAEKEASIHRSQWHAADDALHQLRCNKENRSVWPCVKRRGHTGAHDHPAGMQLVL